MKHNLTAAFLMTALLTSSLISCGGDTADGTVTGSADTAADTAATVTEELDTLEARKLVPDDLETVDYGGRTFRIMGDDACVDYYLMEEQTGDVLNDAIYSRNAAVTERFNIVLEADVFSEDQLIPQLRNTVMAGDDAYQLFSGHIVFAGNAVCDSLYYNWYDVPHINFEKPWYSSSTVEDLTYDGKCFLAMGDFALTTVASTYCVYFNKQIASDYDIEDLYALVKNGAWTIEKMTELTKSVYRDLNGNGEADQADLYGFTMPAWSNANAFLWAFGEKLGKKQSDGTILLDYYNDRVVEIYEQMYELCWNTQGSFVTTTLDEWAIPGTMFVTNQTLFHPSVFNSAATSLRDFETDYGIIPYPKWDEAQEAYYTMVDGGHEGMAVPVSISDPDFVGRITEALNAESYKQTIPTYYDIVLKNKGTRDETSIAILDLILAGRIFDFGYVFGNTDGAAFWMQMLMQQKSSDIASMYEKNHKMFDKKMEKVFTFFEEYENE